MRQNCVRRKKKEKRSKTEGIYLFSLFSFFFLLAVSLLSACQSDEEIKRERYITEGIFLYKNNCANCHQAKGEGLAALYPPIAGSDYLENKNSVICLIRYGQQGRIVVNGKAYNRAMPPMPQLSDLEVAEITTYIYNEWGEEKKVTDAKTVKPILEACRSKAEL